MTVSTPDKSVASIRWLKAPTSWSWVEQANACPMEVLIDHAHCERKAAGSAVQMMFRYLCEPGLGEVLSPLAREELEHFEQVLVVIKARGRYLEPLPSPGYGAELAKHIRKAEPHRMLDSFLVAGLIEARSCERFAVLRDHLDDQELTQFYGNLFESEARHHTTYLKLARTFAPAKDVVRRLDALAFAEQAILDRGSVLPRMHS